MDAYLAETANPTQGPLFLQTADLVVQGAFQRSNRYEIRLIKGIDSSGVEERRGDTVVHFIVLHIPQGALARASRDKAIRHQSHMPSDETERPTLQPRISQS